MRDLTTIEGGNIASNRVAELVMGGFGDGTCGCFIVMHNGVALRVIASSGLGWDHVSVSLSTRCPTWEEMEAVKRAFFRDDETAMQLHVPPARHVNVHPYCLHLWRPHHADIPMPPAVMVG